MFAHIVAVLSNEFTFQYFWSDYGSILIERLLKCPLYKMMLKGGITGMIASASVASLSCLYRAIMLTILCD